MTEKFSVLIIGCGAIAGGYDAADISGPDILTHAKAFRHHDGFDLVGCVDLDPVRARNFADIWQIKQAYTTLDQALTVGNFDIISLCSPTPSHENILYRLRSCTSRLIFCEKPLTDRIASARILAAQYHHRMAVNYLRRFDPEIRRLAGQIAAGKYGGLRSATAHYNKGLYNNGSHMTDLLHMLTGPMAVTAAGTVTGDFWPDDPTISAQLETENGAGITLIGSNVQQGMIFDLELVFEDARITLTDFSNRLTIYPAGEDEQNILCDLNRGMLNALSNIHDHLTLGVRLHSDAASAVRALAICHDIRKMAGLEE